MASRYFPTFEKAGGAAVKAVTNAPRVIGEAAKAAYKVSPALASGAGAVGAGLKGAAGWAGAVGFSNDAFETGKDPGFLLFIFALPIYFAEVIGSFISFQIVALLAVYFKVIHSIFFLPAVVWFIQRGKGLIFTIMFVVWYLVFGGTRNPYTLSTLFAIYVGMMLLFKFSAKGRGTDIGLAALVTEDFFNALLPVGIFFLDVGLVDLLVKEFNFQFIVVIKNLIWFLPFWSLYGLWKTQRRTAIINILQGVSMVYLIIVLSVGLVPNLPRLAHDEGILPSLDQFEKAKQELEASIPRGENPFITNLVCTWNNVGNPQQIESCVKQRQAESKCKHLRNADLPDEKNQEYLDCLAVAKGEKKELDVVGGIDPTIREFTTIDFTMADDGTQISGASQAVPFTISAAAPRKPMDITLGCRFKIREGEGEREISGTTRTEKLTVQGSRRVSITCRPTSPLPNGRHTLIVEAQLENLETVSNLRRVFMGESYGQQTRDNILKDFFPQGMPGSLGPNEFARLDFAAGNPSDEPLIEAADDIHLRAVIRNLGKGTLTAVKAVEIRWLPPLRLTALPGECGYVQQDNRLTKEGITPPESKKVVTPLPLCILEMDDALRQQETFKLVDFTGTLNYDYLLEKSFPIDVQAAPGSMPDGGDLT